MKKPIQTNKCSRDSHQLSFVKSPSGYRKFQEQKCLDKVPVLNQYYYILSRHFEFVNYKLRLWQPSALS